MSGREKALVEPDLLVWARASASMSIEQAADAAKVKVEALTAWEAGDGSPSIAQLKKLAAVYKRPVSVLFLSERPKDFQPLRDFRLLADTGPRILGPKLAYEIRAAQERRQIAIDVLEEVGDEPVKLGVTASLDDDEEQVAAQLRKRLGISIDTQMRWRDGAKAFRLWRDAIEQAGVLVFALSGAHHQIPLEEARGFAIADQPLPVIVVNGKDGQRGRIFTLMHELGHVALGLSAIENSFRPGDRLPAPERKIETFCNRIAAALLLPRNTMLADSLVSAKPQNYAGWTDDEISELATRYSVSRPTLAIRLSEVGKAQSRFVDELLARYERERKSRAAATANVKKGPIAIPWPTQVLSHLGRGYARLILQGYYDRRLSLNSAAAYLGTQSKYMTKIAQATF
jgi:Zn-dependent peptidase ImmA (M78 family)/transcriptional regulator with XRE-family HTH domain